MMTSESVTPRCSAATAGTVSIRATAASRDFIVTFSPYDSGVSVLQQGPVAFVHLVGPGHGLIHALDRDAQAAGPVERSRRNWRSAYVSKAERAQAELPP